MQRTKRANRIRGADFVTHRDRRRGGLARWKRAGHACGGVQPFSTHRRRDGEGGGGGDVWRFGGSPSVVETTVRRLHVGPRERHWTAGPTPPPSNADLDNATASVELVHNIKKQKNLTPSRSPTPVYQHALLNTHRHTK